MHISVIRDMKSGIQQQCSPTTSKYCIKCIQKLINYEERDFTMFLMMPHRCLNYVKNLCLKNITSGSFEVLILVKKLLLN